jgi:hypothetical protein
MHHIDAEAGIPHFKIGVNHELEDCGIEIISPAYGLSVWFDYLHIGEKKAPRHLDCFVICAYHELQY